MDALSPPGALPARRGAIGPPRARLELAGLLDVSPHVDARRHAARLASALFLGSAAAALALLPWLPPTVDRPTAAVLALTSIAIALLIPLLPWERWAERALLTIPLVAMAIVYGGGGYVDGSLEYYGLFMPAVFLFAGLTSDTRGCLLLSVGGLAGTAVAVAGAQEASSLAALLLMLVLAVLIGIILARIQTAQRRTVQAMQGVMDAAAKLGAATTELAVGGVVADITGELLDADHVTVLSDGRGDDHEVRRIGWYTAPVQPGSARIGLRNASRLVLPIPGSVGRGDRGTIVVAWSSARSRAHPVGKHMSGLIAAEAGRVLERLAATARLAAEATTDPLTGLDNRRVFTDRLAILEPGDAVVLCDLDHFKRVNDTLGHVRGDEVLRVFGTCLAQTARSSDTVARYGGEEFALILPQVDPSGAGDIIERLRAAWAATEPVTTFSAGLALHVPGAEPADTFHAADEALYAAKDAGRDRLVVAAGPPPEDPPTDHVSDLQPAPR